MRSTSEPRVGRKVLKKKSGAAARALKPRIGWREWAHLPDFDLHELKAKIDTGAKTSAIFATDITVSETRGERWAHFSVCPDRSKKRPMVRCAAPLVGRRRFKSSNGAVEERYVVETTLSVGQSAFVIELSLAGREEMGFRLLLGRDALKKRFLIDAGASFLLGK